MSATAIPRARPTPTRAAGHELSDIRDPADPRLRDRPGRRCGRRHDRPGSDHERIRAPRRRRDGTTTRAPRRRPARATFPDARLQRDTDASTWPIRKRRRRRAAALRLGRRKAGIAQIPIERAIDRGRERAAPREARRKPLIVPERRMPAILARQSTPDAQRRNHMTATRNRCSSSPGRSLAGASRSPSPAGRASARPRTSRRASGAEPGRLRPEPRRAASARPDLSATSTAGPSRLGDYFGKRPVILILVYSAARRSAARC